MWLANEGPLLITLFYAVYTGMNAVATWLLLTGQTHEDASPFAYRYACLWRGCRLRSP